MTQTKLIAEFLNSIGIPCSAGSLPDPTFLPGIYIRNGTLVYDPGCMLYPGDLLHEAGHLAVLRPADRVRANGSENLSGDLDPAGAELAAIAWSWVASEAIGLPAEVVFHEAGYQDGASCLADNFKAGKYLDHFMLDYVGMTSAKAAGNAVTPVYPQMTHWLRQ